MEFYERLKQICKEQNISIYALEKAIGMSKGSIIKWEKSSPTLDKIEKVANYFDVSVDWLIGRTEPVLTEEEIAAGLTTHVKLKVDAEEYELIMNYRELGKKKGFAYQQLVRDNLEKMLNL